MFDCTSAPVRTLVRDSLCGSKIEGFDFGINGVAPSGYWQMLDACGKANSVDCENVLIYPGNDIRASSKIDQGTLAGLPPLFAETT
jgi:hypothetical protein